MNNPNPTPNGVSLDDMLQAQRRSQANKMLAQSLLGSRSRTPVAPPPQSLNSTIASRSGVQRRHVAPTHNNPAPASRGPRPPPSNNTRSHRQRDTFYEESSALRDATLDNPPYDSHPQRQPNPRQTNNNARGNGRPATNSFNVRGAAKSDQHLVVGENFASGTSAADIEAVMLDVGGPMHSCRLTSTDPVVAEMSFMDRYGAQLVIETFDGKKADSNTLRVYWKSAQSSRERSPAAVGFVVDTEPTAADAMDVDEHTRDREEQNRLREERRGAAPGDSRDRGARNEGYPSGPSADRRAQYDHRSNYNDSRYPNGGGGAGRHYNGGGGGGGGRSYSHRGQGYQS